MNLFILLDMLLGGRIPVKVTKGDNLFCAFFIKCEKVVQFIL